MGTSLKVAFATLAIGFYLTSRVVACDRPSTVDLNHSFIVLTATADAPTGATGFAALQLGACLGTNPPVLHVTTGGLLVGTYSVSVTNDAGESSLGTFDVRQLMIMALVPKGWTNPPPFVTVGEADLPLPAGFDATNGFSVSIADSNTIVDLTGTFADLTNRPPREFREAALLTPTSDAPTSAVGRAVLAIESDDENGTNTAELSVRTMNLLVGNYNVDLTDVSSNAFNLGNFDVNVSTNNEDESVDNHFQGDTTSWWTTTPVGHAEFNLPAGLDASNVVSISISDSNGVVDLVGNFTNSTNLTRCGFEEHVALVPGPTCTNGVGEAHLQIAVVRNKAHNRFTLLAHGVPARQKLTVLVNSTAVSTVASSRQGTVAIKRLPKSVDLLKVTTVQLRDKTGNIVFTANF